MGFLNARSMGNSWEFSRADLSSWKISSGSMRFHQPFSFQIFNWYIYIYRGTIARINLRQTITNYIHIRRQLICFIMFICLGYSSVFIDSLSTVYTAYIHVILWHLMDCDSPPCDSFNPEIWDVVFFAPETNKHRIPLALFPVTKGNYDEMS
jgi:hypothetical protein